MSSRKAKLITHFIAGYPTLEASLETAKGLIDGGAFALEMQIPFSDPSADGPVIESACREALKSGFRVEDSFKLVGKIREYSEIPVFIMSYAAIVFNMGIGQFVGHAAAIGVSGLIIPDLVPGADEGLFEAGRKNSIDIVPVVVPGLSDERLSEIMKEKPSWVYLALRSGITGSYTELGRDNLGFLEKLGTFGVKVMAGFGIKTPGQVEILKPLCDAVIVGSFIVGRVKEVWENRADISMIRQVTKETVRYLVGG